MGKIILSDMDDTLIHEEQKFGEQELIRILGDKYFVSKLSLELIKKIKENASFALVTGRRKHWIDVTNDLFHPDFAIIENGGVILENNQYDSEWQKRMEPVTGKFGEYKGPMWDYKNKIESEGIKTRIEGRCTCFRIYMNGDRYLTEEQKQFFEKKVQNDAGHLGLTTMRSGRCMEVIPALAGKEKAINFLMDKYQLYTKDFMALGDGKNDMGMLEMVGYSACPDNSVPEIKALVSLKGGYVSNLGGHEGTIDILQNALEWSKR